MEGLVRTIVARPWVTIACIAALTAVFAFQLRHLRLEVNLRDELPRDHPYMEIDRRIAARVGAEQTSLLAVGVRHGDIFTPGTLKRIQRLTAGMAKLPGVVPDSVLSLASRQVKAIDVAADGLRVGPLLANVPEDPEALAALRQAVFSYPMYVGNLVTADGKGALIAADFDDRTSATVITAGLENLAAGERDGDTEIYVGGQSPALAALQETTRGIASLLLLAAVVIAVVHYEAFRTLQAVVLPLATAGLSVIWAMGLLTLVGFALTPWTAVTAILVLSVAAGHAVQILKRYYECLADCGDNRQAVVASLVSIGPVMGTAGLVAATGFASLVTFGVPAVRDFGLMACFGILSALAIELTFIPACRALLPAPRLRETMRERRHRFLDPALERIANVVCRRPGMVLSAVVALVFVSALGILRLHVNSSFRSWFGSDAPVIVADRTIRERFTGTSTVRVLVETNEPEGLLDPRAMRGIAALQSVLAREPDITATLSPADFVAVMNRALHEGDEAAYVIPAERNQIAQALLLFGVDDLSRVLTVDYRVAIVQALARSDDVAWIDGVFDRLRRIAAETLPPGVRAEVGGGELAQASAMNATVVRAKLLNMLQVSVVTVALSALVFRSLVAGLLVLAPLVCAALVTLGLMGWCGGWLSFATATYTAAGVSLGADFAIYLLFRLREEVRYRPLPDAIRQTLETSGKAIFFVAAAIGSGYSTLMISGFALWRQLGAYVALMMVTSALATLTLVPALVLLGASRFLGTTTAGSMRAEQADPRRDTDSL